MENIPTEAGDSNSLTAADFRMFERIGVPPELLSAAGIRRIGDRDARELLSLNGSYGDLSGILFPYISPQTGSRVGARVRRDHPEIEGGKPKRKYLPGYGDRRHLYFVPGTEDCFVDSSVPVVLVEAEKSALAITAWSLRTGKRLLAIGLGGCWSWRGRIGKVEDEKGQRVDEVGALPDLAVCAGRQVFILLDANIQTNPSVQAAQRALGKELAKLKAQVRTIRLPQMAGINGPDDFIGQKGDQAFQALLESPAPNVEGKNVVVFQKPKVSGAVRECVLLAVHEGNYDGWFGRGRVHLVIGSSGAGKTTLLVDLLNCQRTGEMYLGHLGAGLRFMILFVDRGDLSNQETLDRMGLVDAKLNINYLPVTTSGWESVTEILGKIEAEETLPEAVFIEGADMLVEDANKAQFVTPFMHALQKIAAHYHIALILSVGSGKSRPKEEYSNRRDRAIGSEKWPRMSDTVLALAKPPGGSDTDSRRVLDVLHRNAQAEKFDLRFSGGLLVPYTPEVEDMSAFCYWASARDWFTVPEAVAALKGEMSQATVYREKDSAFSAGKLERKVDESSGGFFYRWKPAHSHENENEK
jgi:Domain of unknown function (DUF3854)